MKKNSEPTAEDRADRLRARLLVMDSWTAAGEVVAAAADTQDAAQRLARFFGIEQDVAFELLTFSLRDLLTRDPIIRELDFMRESGQIE